MERETTFRSLNYNAPTQRKNTFLIVIIIIVIIGILILIAILYINRDATTTVQAAGTSTGSTAECNIDADCGVGALCIGQVCNACTLPTSPTGLTLQSPTTGTIVASWNVVPLADFYEVRLGIAPQFDILSALIIKQTNNNIIAFTGLGIDTTYYIYVIAKNNCGDSGASGVASLTTQYIFPSRFKLGSPIFPGTAMSSSGSIAPNSIIRSRNTNNNLIFTHDPISKEIKSEANPNMCMTAASSTAPSQVRWQACNTAPAAQKQWSYSNNQDDPILCLTADRNLCIGQGRFPSCSVCEWICPSGYSGTAMSPPCNLLCTSDPCTWASCGFGVTCGIETVDVEQSVTLGTNTIDYFFYEVEAV